MIRPTAITAFFLALIAATAPMPALAAFEWVPPAQVNAAGDMPSAGSAAGHAAMPSVPPVPVDILTPVPGDLADTIPPRRARPPLMNQDAQLSPGMQTIPAPQPLTASPTLADAMPHPSQPGMALVPRAQRGSPNNQLDPFWGQFVKARTKGEGVYPPPSPPGMNGMTASVTSSYGTPLLADGSADDAFVIEGFGRDLPLSIALQQVVPAGYSFQFAPGVDTSSLVSWQGGSSWRQTLHGMLSGMGLEAYVQGQVLNVVPAGMAAPLTPMADLGPMNIAPFNAHPTYGLRMTDIQPLSFDAVPRPPSPGLTPIATADATGVVRLWQANLGDTVPAVMETWARQSGVQLIWKAGSVPPLSSAFQVEGRFIDAVDGLTALYQDRRPPLDVKLYTDTPSRTPVLVVQ